MSCEESLGTLRLTGLERRRPRGGLTALHRPEGGALVPAPGHPWQERHRAVPGRFWVSMRKNVHREGGQALEQAAWRGGWCPVPVSAEGCVDDALSNMLCIWVALKRPGGWTGSLKVLSN